MKKQNSGQIALIILLIMVTLLTIGLSLISYSVTDVKISQDEKEAMRAFSAAEAGIEEALRQEGLGTLWTGGTIDVGDPGKEVTANITVNPGSGDAVRNLDEGEFMNIDLEALTVDADLTIRWESGAALEVIVYETNSIRERFTYSEAGTCAQGFSLADPGVGVTILVSEATDFLMRIRVLCNGTTVTVSSADLPVQEYVITSQAAVGSAEESKTSSIEVSKTISALPPIFDYVLFSEGNIE